MAVIVDASLLVVLASGDARRSVVQAHMRGWLEAGEELDAPELLPYEVASGLTRLVSGGALPAERVEEAWRSAMAVPITYHPLRADGAQAVEIALGLTRKSAYDAPTLPWRSVWAHHSGRSTDHWHGMPASAATRCS